MKNNKIRLIFTSYVIVFLVTIFSVNIVNGQLSNSETVIIYENGTIEPSMSPIQKMGNTYILTGNVNRIRIEESYIILDGNGHEVFGVLDAVFLRDVRNVTIKNLNVSGGEVGIYLIRCSNIIVANNTINGVSAPIPEVQTTTAIAISGGNHIAITGNQISQNPSAIEIGNDAMNIIIFGNNITNNNYGIRLGETSNNTIQYNNFINSSFHTAVSEETGNIFWNNQERGNYWDNYSGNDLNSDGIGDTPFIIDQNNEDLHPLINPVDIETIPEFPSMVILPLLMAVSILALVIRQKTRSNTC